MLPPTRTVPPVVHLIKFARLHNSCINRVASRRSWCQITPLTQCLHSSSHSVITHCDYPPVSALPAMRKRNNFPPLNTDAVIQLAPNCCAPPPCQLFNYQVLRFMHKMVYLSHLVPMIFHNYFTLSTSVHNYSTRHNKLYLSHVSSPSGGRLLHFKEVNFGIDYQNI